MVITDIEAELSVHPAGQFLDSGSFGLVAVAARWAKRHGEPEPHYYDQDRFYRYMDRYAKFVRKHEDDLDYYANVDVIGDPKRSYRNQKYLEGKGVRPVPVIHFGTSVDWLNRYIEDGHKIVAFGGLVLVRSRKQAMRAWLDNMFTVTHGRKKPIKVHGFGMTSFPLMRSYPWYSVDSTSWVRVAAFGNVFIPVKRHGKFDCSKPPLIMSMTKQDRWSYITSTPGERQHVKEWLAEIGIPLGKFKKSGGVKRHGVRTHCYERILANLAFMERFLSTIPPWPRPWQSPQEGFF